MKHWASFNVDVFQLFSTFRSTTGHPVLVVLVSLNSKPYWLRFILKLR